MYCKLVLLELWHIYYIKIITTMIVDNIFSVKKFITQIIVKPVEEILETIINNGISNLW